MYVLYFQHRRRGQAVRQRTANPLSPVRIRAAPLRRAGPCTKPGARDLSVFVLAIRAGAARIQSPRSARVRRGRRPRQNRGFDSSGQSGTRTAARSFRERSGDAPKAHSSIRAAPLSSLCQERWRSRSAYPSFFPQDYCRYQACSRRCWCHVAAIMASPLGDGWIPSVSKWLRL